MPLLAPTSFLRGAGNPSLPLGGKSRAATRLATSIFSIMEKDPTVGRADASRRAMLKCMDDRSNSRNAYPTLWGPFEIVGEGARAHEPQPLFDDKTVFSFKRLVDVLTSEESKVSGSVRVSSCWCRWSGRTYIIACHVDRRRRKN